MDLVLSEENIARLVLAYLKEQNCHGAYHKFLNSSKYLKKYISNKRNISTRFLGENLVGLLQDYIKAYTLVQSRIENTDFFQENSSLKLSNQLKYLFEKYFLEPENSPFYESRCSTPLRGSVLNFPVNHSINATSLNSLPGNSSQEPNVKTPNTSKESHRVSKISEEEGSETGTDNETSNTSEKDTSALAVQAFVQKLLDHQELQEKIADNINTVRHVEHNEDATFYQGLQEVDGAIKSVLEKTHSDPVFESLMTDIIGSVVSAPAEESHSVENPSTSMDEGKNQAQMIAIEENQPKPMSGPNMRATNFFTPNHQLLSVNTANEYIFLDSQRIIDSPNVQFNNPTSTTQNLLMVKPTVDSNQFHNTMPGSLWLISNSQQPLPSIQQQSFVLTSNILTEEDIMKMPTIIIGEENKENKKTSSQPITPHNIAENASNLSEFVTLYKAEDQTPAPLEPPERKRPTTRSVTKKSNLKQVPKKPKPLKAVIKIDVCNESPTKPTEDNKELKDDVNTSQDRKNIKTPDENVIPKSQTPTSSRSHVRALDFNFPSSAKKEIPVKKVSPKPKKSAKTLFESPIKKAVKANLEKKKTPGKKSWDADLRALAAKAAETKNSPKKSTKKVKKKLNRSKESETSTKTVVKTKEEEKPVKDEVIDQKIDDNQNTQEIKEEVTRIIPVVSEEVEKDEKLINRNAKPCYKMKCNIDNATKTEVKVTKLKEVKTFDAVQSETSDKLILSPSKLNANKRSLVSTNEQSILNESLNESIVMKHGMPLLETPIKETFPKTPGFFSPINTNDTPFTKTIKEQLSGVDLTTIPTPNFPITPHFPFTPSIDGQSPNSNRPTDYSTSSSYYQPSDGENRSLEQMLAEETKRLEQKVESDSIIPNDEIEVVSQNKVHVYNPTFADKIKSIKSNVIGRKNLTLIKKTEDSSSSEESDSSRSESSFSSWNDSNIQDKSSEEKQPCYPLCSSKNNQLNSSPVDPIKTIVSNTDYKPVLVDKEPSKELTQQEKILQELEEKRKRTISKIIDDDEKLKSKCKTKTNNKNVNKDETKSTVLTNTLEISSKPNLEPKNEIKDDVIQISTTRRLGYKNKVGKRITTIEDNNTSPSNITNKTILLEENKSIDEQVHEKTDNKVIACTNVENNSCDKNLSRKLFSPQNKETKNSTNMEVWTNMGKEFSQQKNKSGIKAKMSPINSRSKKLVETCVENKELSRKGSKPKTIIPTSEKETKTNTNNGSIVKKTKSDVDKSVKPTANISKQGQIKKNSKNDMKKSKISDESKDNSSLKCSIEIHESNLDPKKINEVKSNDPKKTFESNVEVIQGIINSSSNFATAKKSTFEECLTSLDSNLDSPRLKKRKIDFRKSISPKETVADSSTDKKCKDPESKLDKKMAKTFKELETEMKTKLKEKKISPQPQTTDAISKSVHNEKNSDSETEISQYPPHTEQIVTVMKQWGFPLIPKQNPTNQHSRKCLDLFESLSSDSSDDDEPDDVKNQVEDYQETSKIEKVLIEKSLETEMERVSTDKGPLNTRLEAKKSCENKQTKNNNRKKLEIDPKTINSETTLNKIKTPKKLPNKCSSLKSEDDSHEITNKFVTEDKITCTNIKIQPTLKNALDPTTTNEAKSHASTSKKQKTSENEEIPVIEEDLIKSENDPGDIKLLQNPKLLENEPELPEISKSEIKSIKTKRKDEKDQKIEDKSLKTKTHIQNSSKCEDEIKSGKKPNSKSKLSSPKTLKRTENPVKIECESSLDLIKTNQNEALNKSTCEITKNQLKSNKNEQYLEKSDSICPKSPNNNSSKMPLLSPPEIQSKEHTYAENKMSDISNINSETTENQSVNEDQVEFDEMQYTDFNYTFTYDEKVEVPKKTYDHTVLTKRVSANVIISDSDEVIQKFMTVSEFGTILHIPSKDNTGPRIRILENLLIPKSKARKVIKWNTSNESNSTNESPRVLRSSERLKVNQEKNLKMVESSKNKSIGKKGDSSFGEDDDLMNVAIGMDTIISGVKRKNEEEDAKITKRLKPNSDGQKLLKTVDVEDFLKKIHGEGAS